MNESLKNVFNFFEKPVDPLSFNAVKIGLASPDKIREWSFGEVKKPETINYRTFKPERDGLFCGKIFGPVRDFECICGKYKRKKHRGTVCEKCGVEVIESKVRRERLGHINLACPVAHIWFLKCLPSRIGAVVDLSLKDVEKILYCESYIVLDPKETDLKRNELLSEEKLREKLSQFGNNSFRFGIGAEAVLDMLQGCNVYELAQQLRDALKVTTSDANTKKLIKRLKVVNAFTISDNRPEWMMLTVIPVLPPDLRPLVPLDGGRFATSDLNDLYRRVINRNNRLLRLLELNAPDIIVRNEKRMLQESVDALFDNGRRGKTFTGPNKRPLRSLSDMLKGKSGRFRQNLLGKRVDYSGRSVIVCGPELKLHQCGLPKLMALEMFKPFLFNKLEERGFVSTIKSAKKLVEKERPEIWDLVEEVTKEHPVLLNRAPTLHRLGIQGFEPVLVEGKALQLHPLVCQAFNADFDGDTMCVHVPLSLEAQIEARVLMMSTNNILSPQHGTPVIEPTKDIVLGLYYLTREDPSARGSGMKFSSVREVCQALDHGAVELHSVVDVRVATETGGTEHVRTTVGRCMLFDFLFIRDRDDRSEAYFPFFRDFNKPLDKKALARFVNEVYRICGPKETVIVADSLREFGYKYATASGISICLSDMVIPSEKAGLLKDAREKVKEIMEDYGRGLTTKGEVHNRVIDIWSKVQDDIGNAMVNRISKQKVSNHEGKQVEIPSFNSIFMMADSGARGSKTQMRQLAGMKGLVAKATGEIIETPVTASLREGFTVLEYFINTHGARKGLSDTALKTASSGYLTRQLVDVAQDTIVSEYDCGSLDGVEVSHRVENGNITQKLSARVLGRVSLYDVENPKTGEIVVAANEEITESVAKRLDASEVDRIRVRSVLTCRTRRGVCAKCYGRDLATGHLVNVGEAVGVIAAQSIGEPGTQLTMRTFHQGGAASTTAIQSSFEAKVDGSVKFSENAHFVAGEDPNAPLTALGRNGELIVYGKDGKERERHVVAYGAKVYVRNGQAVKVGDKLVDWDPHSIVIISEVAGRVKYQDLHDALEDRADEATGVVGKTVKEVRDTKVQPALVVVDASGKAVSVTDTRDARYLLPSGATIVVDDGAKVAVGDVLAKIPREQAKTKDITGGLPRVVELFLAQKRRSFAIISEIDGFVSFGADVKGKRRVIVKPEIGDQREYLIPKGRHVVVTEGDFIRAGEPLVDGPLNPHDILQVLGEKALARYLVSEVQDVYRLQGISIDDKHIEIIVKQMLRRVRIKDPGDTEFLPAAQVEKWTFEEQNELAVTRGAKPATAEPLLLGIARAASSTESFISAASFQETTKVLTEAAMSGKVDLLRGLKENVIMGRLIPAGTGVTSYKDVGMFVEGQTLEAEQIIEAATPQLLAGKLGGGHHSHHRY
jgi:DNA-directed RNA polymerase subunit beta'